MYTRSNLRNYLKEAYKVYSGKKASAVVAHIADDVYRKTKYPKEVVVKQAFFEKIFREHPELPKNRLFQFIETLNLQNVEIYDYPMEKKLKFFRTLEDETIHFVYLGLDYSQSQMNVITHYITKKARWVANTKDTGIPVSFEKAEGTPLPSSFA